MFGFLQDPALMLLVSLVVVVGAIIWLRVGAFFALILGALTVSFWNALATGGTLDAGNVVTTVCQALGTTAGNVGLLIVFGTTIGKCMADNGSADRIVLACRRFFGEKRIPAALAGGAFILSIPVFYDATFYLLLPLAKSVYRSVRKNYILYLLSVGLAATISHTTIPPTPGPIAVAETLGVPLSTALGSDLASGSVFSPSRCRSRGSSISSYRIRKSILPFFRNWKRRIVRTSTQTASRLTARRRRRCRPCGWRLFLSFRPCCSLRRRRLSKHSGV